jgi:hypothetical protein
VLSISFSTAPIRMSRESDRIAEYSCHLHSDMEKSNRANAQRQPGVTAALTWQVRQACTRQSHSECDVEKQGTSCSLNQVENARLRNPSQRERRIGRGKFAVLWWLRIEALALKLECHTLKLLLAMGRSPR